MPQQGVHAILISHRHRFICTVPTGDRRLLDYLNDSITDYLHLRNVQVARHTERGRCVDPLPEALVRKTSLGLAVITSERHEAPQRRLASFVVKDRRLAFLTIPGYEVRGILHISARADPLDILLFEKQAFFPLTQATVSGTGIGAGQITAPVVIVQKAWVELLAVGQPAADSEPSPRPQDENAPLDLPSPLLP